MAFELKQFSKESLAATSAAWQKLTTDFDMPFWDYEILLDWAEAHAVYQASNGDSCAYGIFESESVVAEAIVDVVYSPRPGGNWLKMLSVKMGPLFAPHLVENDASKISKLLDIYSVAIDGTIALSGHHIARVVKLYGRTESLLQLLVALNERLKATMAGKLESKMEGRWLVLTTN